MMKLSDIPKSELVQVLKELNFAIKQSEKFSDALPEHTVLNGNNVATQKKDSLTVRQKGRTLLVVRSVTNMLHRSRASEVDGLCTEAKRLGVKIPKAFEIKLKKLNAQDSSDGEQQQQSE